MHNIFKIISQMYSSGGCQRSWRSSSDNRYFNNDTAGGRQGAKGNILLFPDVSSTLHSQMNDLISVGLIFTYSLMIQRGADKYDIMTIAKHA